MNKDFDGFGPVKRMPESHTMHYIQDSKEKQRQTKTTMDRHYK